MPAIVDIFETFTGVASNSFEGSLIFMFAGIFTFLILVFILDIVLTLAGAFK